MDEYIVKVCSNGKGSCYFYKNGKLHRESGSAIILMTKDDLVKLEDKDLYKVELIPEEIPLDYKSQYIIHRYKTLGPGIVGNAAISTNAIHYLNGEPYSLEDFEKIKAKIQLKNELSNELDLNQENIKKVKI